MSSIYLRINGETTIAQPKNLRKLTIKQNALLYDVEQTPGLTTAGLRRVLGHYQAYETSLRDRLFRLVNHGVIDFEEKVVNGVVTERRWFPRTSLQEKIVT